MPFWSLFFSKSSFWYDVFLVLTQALTKDKPSAILFYFHQSLVHNMFRLAPWSHGILLITTYIIKEDSCEDNFRFLSQNSLLSITKGGGKGQKLLTLRGCLLSSLPSQVFPRLRHPQTLPCRVKKSSKPPTLEKGPGKDELVALEDGHGYLVHNDVGWMGPPGKDELLIWILSETWKWNIPFLSEI